MAINLNSHTPIYEQIVEYIRTGVASGVYRPGESLPSVRMLAVSLMVNPNTVQRAFEELQRRDIIAARKGVGYFVADGGSALARSGAQADIKSLLAQTISAARQAGMDDQQIRAFFESELNRPRPGRKRNDDKPR